MPEDRRVLYEPPGWQRADIVARPDSTSMRSRWTLTTWKRNESIKKDRAAKEAARQRFEAERKALLSHRERAIDEALCGIRRSDQLRLLVKELEPRVHDVGGDASAFARWKIWALERADALDIRTKSGDALAEWVANFRISVDD